MVINIGKIIDEHGYSLVEYKIHTHDEVDVITSHYTLKN